jgi:hypothetical protein
MSKLETQLSIPFFRSPAMPLFLLWLVPAGYFHSAHSSIRFQPDTLSRELVHDRKQLPPASLSLTKSMLTIGSLPT